MSDKIPPGSGPSERPWSSQPSPPMYPSGSTHGDLPGAPIGQPDVTGPTTSRSSADMPHPPRGGRLSVVLILTLSLLVISVDYLVYRQYSPARWAVVPTWPWHPFAPTLLALVASIALMSVLVALRRRLDPIPLTGLLVIVVLAFGLGCVIARRDVQYSSGDHPRDELYGFTAAAFTTSFVTEPPASDNSGIEPRADMCWYEVDPDRRSVASDLQANGSQGQVPGASYHDVGKPAVGNQTSGSAFEYSPRDRDDFFPGEVVGRGRLERWDLETGTGEAIDVSGPANVCVVDLDLRVSGSAFSHGPIVAFLSDCGVIEQLFRTTVIALDESDCPTEITIARHQSEAYGNLYSG